jgi:hypothetical protein
MAKKKLTDTAMSNEKDLKNAFLTRFKHICDKMVGIDFWPNIKGRALNALFDKRLPPLKLYFDKAEFTKGEQKIWQQQFNNILSNTILPTPTGHNLSMGEYFRDGILLIWYLRLHIEQYGDSNNLNIHLNHYDEKSPIFLKAVKKILIFTDTICITYSDVSSRMLLRDCLSTVLLEAKIPNNKIKLKFSKPKCIHVNIDGKNREVFQIGWSDIDGRIIYVSLNPSKVGMNDLNIELPIYIQQHALANLAHRLSMQKGLILFMLFSLFNSELKYVKTKSANLLPFDFDNKRLGYLVFGIEDKKVVVRTFLFLTNDGTPEGEKLAKLTKLSKLDKQYLDIDTLAGINKIAIEEHPGLFNLFIEAGCKDLFELSELTSVLEIDSIKKNPDKLVKYLQGNPFFKNFG